MQLNPKVVNVSNRERATVAGIACALSTIVSTRVLLARLKNCAAPLPAYGMCESVLALFESPNLMHVNIEVALERQGE